MTGIITHEESQEITKAFRKAGHDFFSNDLKRCSGGHSEWHIQGDCFSALKSRSWDFVGAHTDCTFLTNAGIRWLTSRTPRPGYLWHDEHKVYVNLDRWKKMEIACAHFLAVYYFLKAAGRGYMENPRMHPYAAKIIGIPPSQIIQPYFFGSRQSKETHLWIVGLPNLVPDNMLTMPKKEENYEEWVAWQSCWTASPGPQRAELRSKTDPNVARAMATQWS